MRLADVRPSQVKAWTAELKAGGAAPSYVYALHSRLSQILGDAVHDGLIPQPGQQRAYIASTGQVCGPCTTPCHNTWRRRSCSRPEAVGGTTTTCNTASPAC